MNKEMGNGIRLLKAERTLIKNIYSQDKYKQISKILSN
jgi:hypothetical protein